MNKDNKLSQDIITHKSTEKHNTEQNIIKIISFIIGCVLGGLIGGYQISAWASPVGATEETEISVKEARDYLNENHIKVPEEIREICEAESERTDILAEALEAMAWVESRFTADITSKDGQCVGIIQINPQVHKARMKRLKVDDLYDAESNIKVGADYLSELCEKYDFETALNAYNGNTKSNSYGKEVIKIAKMLEIAYWD